MSEHVLSTHIKALQCETCFGRFGSEKARERHRQRCIITRKELKTPREIRPEVLEFSEEVRRCNNLDDLISVLYPNGIKQYDIKDRTDSTQMIPCSISQVMFANTNCIQLDLGLGGLQPALNTFIETSPVANRLPAHDISRDTVGRSFGQNRLGAIAQLQPYIYAQTSGAMPKPGEMETRWGVSLAMGENRHTSNAYHPEILPPGMHIVSETSQTNQPMPHSSGRAMNTGGQFLSPHHGQLGHAFDAGYFPRPDDQFPEESNSGGNQFLFPQTNQPVRTRWSPGQCDYTTPDFRGPSAGGGFAGTPEDTHMQTMYPHLVGPGKPISFVTNHLNLVEIYTPAMREPLLREFLKGLSPTMVELLGSMISRIRDGADLSTAGAGRGSLSIKWPINKFQQIRTSERYRQ